jgi:predicted alpha/beta-hydrolase family hydrolase
VKPSAVPADVDWTVDVDGFPLRVRYEPSAHGPDAPVFVFAHGAGGHRDDPGMVSLASLLRERACAVVRFNFPYRERGSHRPDPMPALTASIAAVATRVREQRPGAGIVLGGRSMGGRAASMLAAEGFACEGLLLLAYPLHPAGEPEKLRTAHLARIGVPVLCINGTRDRLCERARMDAVVAPLAPTWTMHWIDAADHGFHVPKMSGRSDADVRDEVGGVVCEWIAKVLGTRR